MKIGSQAEQNRLHGKSSKLTGVISRATKAIFVPIYNPLFTMIIFFEDNFYVKYTGISGFTSTRYGLGDRRMSNIYFFINSYLWHTYKACFI